MDRSPLSRLPRELQDLIFEYALSFSAPLVRLESLDDLNDKDQRPSTALVQTCREVYAQTKDLVYILNTFLLRPPSNARNDSYSFLLRDFLTHINPRYWSRIRGVVVEVQASAGYFGENAQGLRSIVENLSTRSFPMPVWVRPVFLKDSFTKSAAELEAFWEVVQLDARCAGTCSSLEVVVARVQEQMKKEECQEEYQDLFWAKRLYLQYLELEQQLQAKDRLDAKAKDPVSSYIGMLASWRLELNPPVSMEYIQRS